MQRVTRPFCCLQVVDEKREKTDSWLSKRKSGGGGGGAGAAEAAGGSGDGGGCGSGEGEGGAGARSAGITKGGHKVRSQSVKDRAGVLFTCYENVPSVPTIQAHPFTTMSNSLLQLLRTHCFRRCLLLQVSKSTFTASSSATHADVSVDDPEFWKKVAPARRSPAPQAPLLRSVCCTSLGAQ